jgi:hypothetical protein
MVPLIVYNTAKLPTAQLISTVNHHASPKSVISLYLYEIKMSKENKQEYSINFNTSIN